MSEYQDNRPPEEIESDIQRTRADMSSTIDAIQSKLTPGQLMDQAVAYARTSLPADFGANLGNTVRDNPIPVALIGVGIAWLMSSSRNADGRARMRRQARYEEDAAYERESRRLLDAGRAHTVGYAGGDASLHDSGNGAMHRAASAVSSTGHDLKDKASQTGKELKDKASDLGHRISDTASSLTGRAREMTEGARERGASARARIGEVSQRSQQQYYRAKDSFGHILDEQPLLVGALGVAIGTVLGAVLPSTRREDELMGRTRDDLWENTKDMAMEQVDSVKESAKRVAATAEQEARKVGDDVAKRVESQAKAGQSTPNGADAVKSNTMQGQRPH